jgi:hypothetical protein
MCVFRYRMFTDSWMDVLDRVNLCIYHWPPRMTEDKSKNHGVKLWAISLVQFPSPTSDFQ